ncbi:MAG: putative rane protein, partial [Microbacterium sp.]|nr:putative rane protein [Microbacterium sp.]
MADTLADRRSPLRPALDVVRGALIVGVYATLIDAASHIVRGTVAARDVVRGRGLTRSARHFRAVRWRVVAP